MSERPMSIPPADALQISDNRDAHRLEGYVGAELAGFIDYHVQPGLLTILETEVHQAFEGRGVGSRLIAAALEDARGRGMQVLPICPFATAYIHRHSEYADLLRFK
jgi:predicted GNAT family acetyltransferase